MSELSPTNILKVLESRCRPNSDIEGLAATIAVDLSELAELSQETRPILFADTAGQMMNRSTTVVDRKRRGQYFTPPQVAEFMVRLFSKLPEQARLLEPGAGSGVLVAALAEHISATQPEVRSLHVQAFENSPQLAAVLELTLGYTRTYLAERGTRMTYLVHNDDFILAHMDRIRPTLFTPTDLEPLAYDLVISNPPYFKLQKADPRVAILSNIVHGQPNIYALFMALSAELLSESGQLVFITPRSFCSGQYFRQFRKWLFRRILIERIHAFGSRREAFGRPARECHHRWQEIAPGQRCFRRNLLQRRRC